MIRCGKKANKGDMEIGIKNCINLYHARGLTVTQINTDNKFACIEEAISPTTLNYVAA